MSDDEKVLAAVRISALMTGAAAAIHLAVAGPHFRQWWLFGLFFLALAVGQGGLALRTWFAPSVRVLAAVGLVNLLAVAVWLLSRTSGVPIGPAAGTPEPWGVTDGLCAALELVAAAAAGAAVLLQRRTSTPLTGRTPTRAVGAVVAVAAGLVLVAGGVAVAAPGESGEHGHSESAEHDHDGDAHQHEESGPGAHGNGERHAMANLPDVAGASAAQTDAARGLLTELTASTRPFRDASAAERAGYDVQAALRRWQRKHDGKALGEIAALHVPRQAARQDGRLVDPEAPETLIYHRAADGTLTLVGVMFTAEGQQPPDGYQPYLRWHYHQTCVGAGGEKSKPAAHDADCPAGTTTRTSGYMTHVWFVAPGTDAEQLRYAYALRLPKQQLRAADQQSAAPSAEPSA